MVTYQKPTVVYPRENIIKEERGKKEKGKSAKKKGAEPAWVVTHPLQEEEDDKHLIHKNSRGAI